MPPKDVPSPASVLPLVGSVATSGGGGGADGVRGVQDRRDWTPGRFAVPPLPAESSVPPLIGRIVEAVKGTEHEILLIGISFTGIASNKGGVSGHKTKTSIHLTAESQIRVKSLWMR